MKVILALLVLVAFVSTSFAQTCGDGLCSLDFAENAINCPEDCADICPCRPYCEDRECGPDGCGGSCGDCSFPFACNDIGRCECARNCIGKECGDDGCNVGNECDFCGPDQICGADFLCTGACVPNCINPDGSRRECGNDGCFGSCGECTPVPGQDIRCRDGVCTCRPQCDMIECGSDGCGGDCGICEGDAQCIEGFCVYPVLGCCGDGVCDGADGEDVCSCRSDCPGCCVNDVCEPIFGEDEFNCPLDCIEEVQIEVRERPTDALVLESCSISVTGPNAFSAEHTYSPNAISFRFEDGGFGTYTFTTVCPSYVSTTETRVLDENTSLITLYVDFRALIIEVRDELTLELLPSASLTITFGAGFETYTWVSPSLSWVPFAGYGISYTFDASASGYLDDQEFHFVELSTEVIVITLARNSLPIVVTSCETQEPITATVTATSSDFADFSATLTVSGTTTSFTHVGFGTYSFAGSADGYDDASHAANIQLTTTEVRFCLPQSAFCGDGICNAAETASPTNANRCHDCGRLRGVISLAVGQKDQLVNITVSVWAHPTNPALFMRDGDPVPDPHFTVLSDSKGFFGISTLSFDAPRGQADPGQYSRRFYFSLSGQFTDRSGDDDVVITLLPLWWNYELVNTQWLGSGDLTATNNSPSLYFYMTPPFPQEDALVRVILSWGTLISNPSNSLPDMDLVVAGPVDDNSISQYGTGIINFQNKDAHAETEELPFAKLITDSAQGFGPEVFDFYGRDFTNIGFSESYAPGAEANAYEIWVDRPNSSPNQDSAFTFLYDTNSFIVVYVNNGVVNEQVLFDELTEVEHAYGFYNNDQWNDIPVDATMWHIIDIIEGPTTIKFQGFPGEDDANDRSEAAGAKYAFNAGFFEATKSVPCGHTSARGANPAYCPATLEYPQNNKK